ncbi:unnamed protein product [Amaranthus hypochondriacus]
MSSSVNNSGVEESKQLAEQLGKTLKEGERLVGPTRRPDGTLRKPIRIRAGYVPQEEVAIYQSKGTLLRKEMESQVGPPGYDPEPGTVAKPKSKSVKRNERKKEKKQQTAIDRANNLENSADEVKEERSTKDPSPDSKALESVSSQISQLALSSIVDDGRSLTPAEGSDTSVTAGVDIDKKIRAVKKKIRLAEAQLQKVSPEDMKPEQLEKVKKLEGWREELKLLENGNTASLSAS